jgi:hypothetical protein
MLEPTTIDADELRLAQLACAKLAGLVQGALSVGLALPINQPASATGFPDPRLFFDERFRVLTGFALVLHSVSGMPQQIQRLREKSRQVLTTSDELRRRLSDHLDSPAEPAGTLVEARNAASALCDALRAYGDLIQLDPTQIAKVKGVVLQLFNGLENMSRVDEPTAH